MYRSSSSEICDLVVANVALSGVREEEVGLLLEASRPAQAARKAHVVDEYLRFSTRPIDRCGRSAELLVAEEVAENDRGYAEATPRP